MYIFRNDCVYVVVNHFHFISTLYPLNIGQHYYTLYMKFVIIEVYFLLVVEVDLKAEYFKPGKPCYERTNTCVTNQQELRADFIFSLDSCGKG